MALHAFCDEGSVAAAFPFSTLFMTIENKEPDDAFARLHFFIFSLQSVWSSA